MTRPWPWILAIALFLLACLGFGLWAAQQIAPPPAIGVLRFEQVIDFETAAWANQILKTAREDPAVAGVVVEILSPGGYATSSESLYYALLDLRRAKPVVAAIDGLAASGGYYMAVAANRILAPPSAYVGNVGTRGGRPMDPLIFPEELSSGPFKLSGGSRFDQIHQLDLVATSFISNVVHQRSLSAGNALATDAETVAEARIYLGSEAQALGLIDGEGSLADATAAAAALAGLAEWRVIDLAEAYGVEPPYGAEVPLAERARLLVSSAPPDTIYMLDDRIPLPGLAERDAVLAQLLHLRGEGNFTAAIAGPGGAAGQAQSSLLPFSPAWRTPSGGGNQP